ncbi:MAG: fused MFS/spermidine synthase [Planctomycetes bacterium]|nr:fused MFS/spermidine synthase [Planctomycetota bacterium]
MIGAILGSLVAGFVLLDWLGLWTAVMVFSLLYPAAAAVLPVRIRHLGLGWRAAGVAVLLLCFFRLNPSQLPRVLVNQHDDGEELVEVFEGSGGTVAVTRHVRPNMPPADYPLSIKLNNHYGLGSTVAMTQQQMQADIPLMVRPETQNAFFLGMGTGITPGTALEDYYSVDRVVTCELVPEVVTAARKYFEPYVNGLFTDARSTVVVDDGRHYLFCTPETFDLIDADLFVPCRSGAGSLYTVEHFRTARERLKPGGMFVQWLPLYQLTREEFGIIARSMLEAFPQVTLWRGNFRPGEEVVGLVGHRDTEPLPAAEPEWASERNMVIMAWSVERLSVLDLEHLVLPLTPRTVLIFYCGNLSAIGDRFDQYPINTDDRPRIEYLAPRSHRREAAGQASWFVAGELIGLLETLQQACPPETDPMLANRTPSERRLPRAGLSFHQARVHASGDSWEAADEAWQAFFPDWLARDE